MAMTDEIAMSMTPLMAVASLGLTLVHSGLIFLMWTRAEDQRNRHTETDARTRAMEAHLQSIEVVRVRQHAQGEQLAALIERSKSMQDAMLSIQDYLRGKQQ